MLARDIMTTRLVTLHPDSSITEAVRLMLQHHISGLPVTDREGRLIGIVSEGDLLRRTELDTEKRRPRWIEFLRGPGGSAGDYIRTHGRRVEEIMTSEMKTVTEDATLDSIVAIMEKHRVKRVLVVRAGKLAGIVTRADLLRALARIAGEAKPTGETDRSIRARILEELHKQPWAAAGSVNVIVRDGIVDLTGAILDERERGALRVAAENTPGVTQVRDHLVWIEPVSGFVIDPDEDRGRDGPERRSS
jgi:CBS domain-containing protein